MAKCADFLRYLWRFPARRKSCPRGRRSGFPSLTDVTSGFFYSMGAAAARESRGRIIKNPRSPRGKNDRVSLFRSSGSRPQIIRVSRVELKGEERRVTQGWKEKKKRKYSHGTTRNPREEVSSVERIGIAYPFDNGERMQEPLFSSLFPPPGKLGLVHA